MVGLRGYVQFSKHTHTQTQTQTHKHTHTHTRHRWKRKKCRKERVGSVAANPDNLESNKEAGGGGHKEAGLKQDLYK